MAFTNPFRKRVTLVITDEAMRVENATENFAALMAAYWVGEFGHPQPEKKTPIGFAKAEEAEE